MRHNEAAGKIISRRRIHKMDEKVQQRRQVAHDALQALPPEDTQAKKDIATTALQKLPHQYKVFPPKTKLLSPDNYKHLRSRLLTAYGSG